MNVYMVCGICVCVVYMNVYMVCVYRVCGACGVCMFAVRTYMNVYGVRYVCVWCIGCVVRVVCVRTYMNVYMVCGMCVCGV